MKRMMSVVALALVLALAGCGMDGGAGLGSIPAPAAVAERTTIDEQAATGFELAYTAAARSAVLARQAGLIGADRWPAVQRLDGRAYAALLGVRRAYAAGNAETIGAAIGEARAALSALVAAAQ